MNLLTLIQEKQAALVVLKQDLHQLEAELKEARTALARTNHRSRFKPESSIALAIRVLKEEGSPLPITELVHRISMLGYPITRGGLTSNICRFIEQKQVFFREQRGVYGLRNDIETAEAQLTPYAPRGTVPVARGPQT
jgi:hypothetical protein